MQDDLHIAGDAAREVVRRAQGFVKRGDADGIGPTDGRGQRLGGGAQHVDVGVDGCLVAPGGAGVAVERGRCLVAAECRDHLCPEQPRRAQLGDFHEETAANGHVKVNRARRRIDVEATCGQGAEIGYARGQPEGQFLRGTAPGIVVDVAANGDRSQPRRVDGGPLCHSRHLVIGIVQRQRQRALFGQNAQRVGDHTAGQLVGGPFCAPLARDQSGQQRHGRRAGVGNQRHARKKHPAQRLDQIGGRGQRKTVAAHFARGGVGVKAGACRGVG